MKSKIQISLSSPQMDHAVTQFDLDDPQMNRAGARTFVDKGVELKLWGYTFLRVRHPDGAESVVLLDQGNEHVVLWINSIHHRSPQIDRPTLVVLAAWQQRGPELNGLVRRMYLDHYLPMYKCLESSSEHRSMGKVMWIKLIAESLERGLHVRTLDVNKTFNYINKMSDLQPHLVWGNEDRYKDAKIFISKDRIEDLTRLPSFSAVAYEMTY